MKRFLYIMAIILVSGCAGEEAPVEPVVSADPYPANSTPEGAIRRFIVTYEAMDTTEFSKLFTVDYIFEFSNSTDPDLVNKFSAGWFKDDEVISSKNLFVGGANSEGEIQSAATSIDLNLDNLIPVADPVFKGGAGTHMRLATGLNLIIQLPPSQSDPEGTTFEIGAVDPAFHRFFLVRGDAAELDSNQPGGASNWYIWKWRDESTASRGIPPSGPVFDVARQTLESSWGRVKGLYR